MQIEFCMGKFHLNDTRIEVFKQRMPLAKNDFWKRIYFDIEIFLTGK